MAGEAKPPFLLKPVPDLITNEGAAFGPLDLKNFIRSNATSGKTIFSAQISDGRALPQGLICTQDGLLSGIAAADTNGNYQIQLTATNDSDTPLLTEFRLTIKPRLTMGDTNFLSELKAQVWQALEQNIPVPDLSDIVNRPITPIEIYYLLQRYAVLTIWDVYNLEAPGEKVLLNLEGVNKHYDIYDRGSCIVGAPKDLFSHERTLADALETSRVMAREVYQRGWTIEFGGFNKMVRAAWIELQHLGQKHGKPLEILHYEPTLNDIKVFTMQSKNKPAP